MYMELANILGGPRILKSKIETQFDLVELSRKGVPKDALLSLQKFLSLTRKQIVDLLPISERTIQRQKRKKLFNPVVTEHLLKIAEVAAKGTEVFNDKMKFLDWLNQPNINFNYKTPLSILDSGFGAEMVIDELGRIEHGVYS
jgi:putative toxin-antitoxin system antitoxin component (TIGR02293 family)